MSGGRDIETEFKCTYRDMEQGWALSEKDRTGMTEPLTTGQQIVAWWETSTSASEPADLAEKIDEEIERLRDRLHDEASLAEDRKLEIERLRAALRETVEAYERSQDFLLPDAYIIKRAKEALGDE